MSLNFPTNSFMLSQKQAFLSPELSLSILALLIIVVFSYFAEWLSSLVAFHSFDESLGRLITPQKTAPARSLLDSILHNILPLLIRLLDNLLDWIGTGYLGFPAF